MQQQTAKSLARYIRHPPNPIYDNEFLQGYDYFFTL